MNEKIENMYKDMINRINKLSYYDQIAINRNLCVSLMLKFFSVDDVANVIDDVLKEYEKSD